eukprot:2266229-Alexandrium_andersonii.AAC.1
MGMWSPTRDHGRGSPLWDGGLNAQPGAHRTIPLRLRDPGPPGTPHSVRTAATAQAPPCPGTWLSGIRRPGRGDGPTAGCGWPSTPPRKRRRWTIAGALREWIRALPGNRHDERGLGQPRRLARPMGRLRTRLGPHAPERQVVARASARANRSRQGREGAQSGLRKDFADEGTRPNPDHRQAPQNRF